MTRAEKVVEAQRLRAEGLLLREIAERMGAPISTVQEWISDPDLSKHAQRRRRKGGACVDCGKPTDGSNGPAERCAGCFRRHRHESRHWTRERIVAAIQDFARRYGEPPTAREWNPAHARRNGHVDSAERFERDACWPWTQTVRDEFGSWNAAITAAGFTPFKPGHRVRVAA